MKIAAKHGIIGHFPTLSIGGIIGDSPSPNAGHKRGFQWVRPTGGWKIIEAKREVWMYDEGLPDVPYPVWSKPFDLLVPRYIAGKTELYSPELQSDSIFLEIPDLQKMDSVQLFCDRWGAPEPSSLIPAAPISPEELNPEEFILGDDESYSVPVIFGIPSPECGVLALEPIEELRSSVRSNPSHGRNHKALQGLQEIDEPAER